MKRDVRIAGAILVLAGCVILDQPVPLSLFVYAIFLSVSGLFCMVGGSLCPKLTRSVTTLFGDVREEIQRQNP